jgi:hypothetical protein
MRPCFMFLLLRYGVPFLPESLWNGAGMSHASNPSEVLSIDNALYPINTRLEPRRATHSLWQGSASPGMKPAAKLNEYLGAFHCRS